MSKPRNYSLKKFPSNYWNRLCSGWVGGLPCILWSCLQVSVKIHSPKQFQQSPTPNLPRQTSSSPGPLWDPLSPFWVCPSTGCTSKSGGFPKLSLRSLAVFMVSRWVAWWWFVVSCLPKLLGRMGLPPSSIHYPCVFCVAISCYA